MVEDRQFLGPGSRPGDDDSPVPPNRNLPIVDGHQGGIRVDPNRAVVDPPTAVPRAAIPDSTGPIERQSPRIHTGRPAQSLRERGRSVFESIIRCRTAATAEHEPLTVVAGEDVGLFHVATHAPAHEHRDRDVIGDVDRDRGMPATPAQASNRCELTGLDDAEALGISAFEVYQVELPPGAETVRHDHLDDGVEDLYFIVSGEGWVLVDDEQLTIRPGQFIAVSVESTRQLRAGNRGLSLVALCGVPRR